MLVLYTSPETSSVEEREGRKDAGFDLLLERETFVIIVGV